MDKRFALFAVIIFIVLLIILVFVFLILTGTTPQEKEPIKIGFIGPLSGSGAAWGIEQKNALDIGIQEINTAGSINDRNLKIIYEDGKCDGKEATIAAEKLISVDKVNILMPVCSSETLAVIPIANRNNVLVMAVWPTNPSISGSGDYIFRNSYSDNVVGKRMAEIISKNFSHVGVLTELSDYSAGLRDSFKKNFSGEVFEENYAPDAKDLRAQLTKLIASRPDAVLINPNSVATGLVALHQLKELGYNGKLFGNFFGESTDVIQSPDSNGLIFFADPVVENNQIKQQLFSKYISIYGKKPDFEFAVSAEYDSIHILAQALENVGDEPPKLKDYLHSMPSFSGVLGTYHFDSNGDATGFVPAVKQILNGNVVLVQ